MSSQGRPQADEGTPAAFLERLAAREGDRLRARTVLGRQRESLSEVSGDSSPPSESWGLGMTWVEELRAAEAARMAGEEGKARVHARRAAGWAAADYYRRVVGPSRPIGAVECLRWFAARSELPVELRQAARRLTVHVTADHVLPHPEDPLVDARMIVDNLARSKF